MWIVEWSIFTVNAVIFLLEALGDDAEVEFSEISSQMEEEDLWFAYIWFLSRDLCVDGSGVQ